MDWGSFARAIHILSVVVWIGGVSLITTALLPAIKQKPPAEAIHDFDAVERRFAPQARIAVLLVLLSGLYMLYDYDLWDRFADAHFWWMDLMVGVWVIFAALLFVVEPLSIRHTVRLAPSQAILAAVGGSHGLF